MGQRKLSGEGEEEKFTTFARVGAASKLRSGNVAWFRLKEISHGDTLVLPGRNNDCDVCRL